MADIGISVMYSEDVKIEGNIIENMTTAEDMYNVGIMLWKSDSVTVENNNLTDIGYIGVYVPNNNNNLIIKNNYIDMMEISRKYSDTLSEDWCDPVIGIGIGALLSSWTQGHSSLEENGNRDSLSELRSTDINIQNNTFGPNVQVLLYTEGTENLTHDLTDYWLFSYFYPRITDRDDLYISNNWLELSHVTRLADRTEHFDGPRVITNVMQKIYSHFSPRGRTVFFNYIVEKGNIKILPQGYKIYTNGNVVDFDDLPHDFYLYNPVYTPFGLNKLSTIYANGTTHILLYNDLTEPDGYHTMNMTVTPSSDSVDVTVLNFNSTYKKWTVYSDNPSVTVDHVIGDFTPFTDILIKKNGIDWSSCVSDSDGYVSFVYDEGFSEITFEAVQVPEVPSGNYTILKSGWNLISIPFIQGEQDMISVLDSIDGLYDAVQWYDSSDPSDPWKIHVVGKPFGNDLFELNETMGFWVHITQPGDTIFVYNGTQPASNQTIQLHTGWNMVGYPSLTSYNRTEGLNNLAFDSEVKAIWSYNTETQTWEEMGEGDSFEIGRGYWVLAMDEVVWQVPL
jgi:parallel beta-helix repeat protein